MALLCFCVVCSEQDAWRHLPRLFHAAVRTGNILWRGAILTGVCLWRKLVFKKVNKQEQLWVSFSFCPRKTKNQVEVHATCCAGFCVNTNAICLALTVCTLAAAVGLSWLINCNCNYEEKSAHCSSLLHAFNATSTGVTFRVQCSSSD